MTGTIIMFEKSGFIIHPEKSKVFLFFPKQKIVFLGFEINSVTMKVFLTKDKKSQIKDHLLLALQSHDKLKIDYVAKIIGYLVSRLPAVQLGGTKFGI